MNLLGHVNGLLNKHVWGWAKETISDQPVRVDINLDGEKLASIPCDKYRPDLVEKGLKDGRHGFLFPLPSGVYRDFKSHKIEVRFNENQQLLPEGTLEIDSVNDSLYEKIRHHVFREGLWDIREVEADGGVEIRGWAVRPYYWFREWTFTLNTRPFANVELQKGDFQLSNDLQLDEDRLCYFRCMTPSEALQPGETDWEFALVDSRTLKPFSPTQNLYLLEDPFPLPDVTQRKRIMCSSDLASFRTIGSTAYKKLGQVLERVFGKTYDDFPTIMDWGCGCGRVLRYIVARHRIHLVGVDIDPVNLHWCQEVFANHSFEVANLDPPLRQPAEKFDLVYGLSVFTHLKENSQFKWLKELHRVTRPGGVLLMTVNGDPAWFRNNLSQGGYADWKRRGFLDANRDPALDQVIPDQEYYRAVFHDTSYILREWGRFFQIVEIIPGCFNNWQDLVVMVRK